MLLFQAHGSAVAFGMKSATSRPTPQSQLSDARDIMLAHASDDIHAKAAANLGSYAICVRAEDEFVRTMRTLGVSCVPVLGPVDYSVYAAPSGLDGTTASLEIFHGHRDVPSSLQLTFSTSTGNLIMLTTFDYPVPAQVYMAYEKLRRWQVDFSPGASDYGDVDRSCCGVGRDHPRALEIKALSGQRYCFTLDRRTLGFGVSSGPASADEVHDAPSIVSVTRSCRLPAQDCKRSGQLLAMFSTMHFEYGAESASIEAIQGVPLIVD